MAAPKGNDFWKRRSKHGRDRIFTNANDMLEAAFEYFEWCVANPLKEQKLSGGRKVVVDKVRPFSERGMCLFWGTHSKYLNEFRKTAPKDFSDVLATIDEIIYTQKIDNAAAGLLNASVIARELGLTDKSQVDAIVSIQQITGMEVN